MDSMAAVQNFVASIPQGVQLGLAGLGALLVLRKTLSYLHLVANLFVLSGTDLRKYGKKGTWAVVTGASDGLGKEFAWQLAAKGFNLVLVSRTEAKLETLAKELEQKHAGLQTKILAMDFARDSASDYERLGQLVSGLDIGILVNNVGQSHAIPVPFLETAAGELQDIVTINCLGTLKTTQMVAPLLAQRPGKGLVLTIGSFGGWTPTPYLATYSGSKAFLQHWSSALAAELKPAGVDVELALGYLITTAMSKVRRTSVLIPNPRQFVRSALGRVGQGSTQQAAYTYTPYWSHALFLWVVENTVGAASKLTIGINLKMHVDIRNRALRKAAREKRE